MKNHHETIIIKIGTNTLSDINKGINTSVIEKLSAVISKLKNIRHKVLLVTSGAVALGVKKLGLKEKPKTISKKQACASIGQALLMQTYEKYF